MADTTARFAVVSGVTADHRVNCAQPTLACEELTKAEFLDKYGLMRCEGELEKFLQTGLVGERILARQGYLFLVRIQ